MWMYVVKRVMAFIPTVFIVVTVIFFLTRVVPGDPAWVLVGHQLATEEKVAEVRRELGLDKPILTQYLIWLPRAIQGDFGSSIFFKQPVIQVISERFPVTLSLAGLSLLVTIVVGVPLGIISAWKHNTKVDHFSTIFSVLGISMPSFWLGFLLVMVFSVNFGWFPTSGYRPLSLGFVPWISHLVLPVISLSMAEMALLTRMTRSSMLEVLGKEYIVTARAKGLSEGMVVYKHAFKNALVTVVTVVGLIFALSLGGSVLIENVFAIPGLGRLMVSAAIRRDYPIVEGGMIYFTGIALFVNLLVDISYTLINPKLTYEK
ncbi:MAG: ABC transporter permease [Ignavibacteria bacterium]|nr:ABC transporter permease [Ignavibacteria bacterium]